MKISRYYWRAHNLYCVGNSGIDGGRITRQQYQVAQGNFTGANINKARCFVDGVSANDDSTSKYVHSGKRSAEVLRR